MPPKKKKGKGKKKKKKDGTFRGMSVEVIGASSHKPEQIKRNSCVSKVCLFLIFDFKDKGELTVEDKYKRTMQEIEVLRDELGK